MKCWLFHKWTKWSNPTVVTTFNDVTNDDGGTVAQSKVCERCNMKKWRRVLVTN
jgi:hypothetical protein